MAPQETRVSRRSDFVLAVSSLCVFGLSSLVTNLETALAIAVAVMVFIAIIQTKRDSWTDKRFWALLAVFAVAHIILFSLIHIPKLQYGLMALPFALVDGFAMWGIINWIDRRFPRPKRSL